MFKPLQAVELHAFYLWLRGLLSPRQRDDLAIVFVMCPNERPKLVREFCDDMRAPSRIKAFNQYFNHIRLS